MGARLVLVASPLGNLGDLSPRAREELCAADFWLVEDSRVSGKLASYLEVKKPMLVLNEHTPPGKIEQYVNRIAAGESAAVLSDGGAPCISDPGAILVDLAHEQSIEIDAIPGPSAVVNALMLSGFFAQRFAFLGFLGRKAGDIRSELKAFDESRLTIVLFESPYRIDALLKAAFEQLGPRRFVICRELTKIHQQVFRGVLGEIPDDKAVPRKGEFTIVIEGVRRKRADEVQKGTAVRR